MDKETLHKYVLGISVSDGHKNQTIVYAKQTIEAILKILEPHKDELNSIYLKDQEIIGSILKEASDNEKKKKIMYDNALTNGNVLDAEL